MCKFSSRMHLWNGITASVWKMPASYYSAQRGIPGSLALKVKWAAAGVRSEDQALVLQTSFSVPELPWQNWLEYWSKNGRTLGLQRDGEIQGMLVLTSWGCWSVQSEPSLDPVRIADLHFKSNIICLLFFRWPDSGNMGFSPGRSLTCEMKK